MSALTIGRWTIIIINYREKGVSLWCRGVSCIGVQRYITSGLLHSCSRLLPKKFSQFLSNKIRCVENYFGKNFIDENFQIYSIFKRSIYVSMCTSNWTWNWTWNWNFLNSLVRIYHISILTAAYSVSPCTIWWVQPSEYVGSQQAFMLAVEFAKNVFLKHAVLIYSGCCWTPTQWSWTLGDSSPKILLLLQKQFNICFLTVDSFV